MHEGGLKGMVSKLCMESRRERKSCVDLACEYNSTVSSGNKARSSFEPHTDCVSSKCAIMINTASA